MQCDVVQLHLQDRPSLRDLAPAVALGHSAAWAMFLPRLAVHEASGSAMQAVH